MGTASALFWNYDFVGKMNDPIITALNRMSERYTPYLKRPVPEQLKMNESEYNQIETVSASLDTYIASSEYDFIKGNKYATSDADWNEYLRKLEQYNYQTLLKCYNDAYSRLNS